MRPGRCILLVCIPSAEKGRNEQRCSSAENRTNRPTKLSANSFHSSVAFVRLRGQRHTLPLMMADDICHRLSFEDILFPQNIPAFSSFSFDRTGGEGTPLGRYVPPLPTVRIIFEPRGWPRGNNVNTLIRRRRYIAFIRGRVCLCPLKRTNCLTKSNTFADTFGDRFVLFSADIFLNVRLFSADGMHTKSMHLPGRT